MPNLHKLITKMAVFSLIALAGHRYCLLPALAGNPVTNSTADKSPPSANPWDRTTSDYSSANAHSDTATGTTAASPAGTTAASPAGTTAASPAGTTAASPAGTTAGSPAGTTAGSPAGTTAGSPAGTTAGSPAGTTAGSPAGTTAGSAAGTTANAASTTAGSPAGKHVFPGIGDANLWKAAQDLSNEGRRADLVGDGDMAISKFSKAVIMYQFDPQLYYELGMFYLKRQSIDTKAMEENDNAAEVCFRRALKLDRGLWYVWKAIAKISYERKNFAPAIYEFQHCIDCNPPATEVAEIKHDLEGAKKEIEKAKEASLSSVSSSLK